MRELEVDNGEVDVAEPIEITGTEPEPPELPELEADAEAAPEEAPEAAAEGEPA